jgi:hypothetical protein
LIEMAVVLLVMGLLIAGVLKGQELMTASRVRTLIQQQDGIKTAYFGFLDRYRALPGDYRYATSALTGLSSVCGVPGDPGNGNGNALIQSVNGESILAWEHLSKSGFLTGTYVCTGNSAINPGSVPRNSYGQYLQLIYDDNYAGTPRDNHNLKTGNDLPSNILAEADRKVDDGNALRGTFRGSTYTTGSATDAACWDAATGVWNSQAGVPNCGGATLF